MRPIDSRLGIRLRVLRRTLYLAADHVLPEIILLADIERPDLRCALREQRIRDAQDLGLALLHHHVEAQDGDVGTDDAAAHGLVLALAHAVGVVAGVAVSKEAHVVREHTPPHGEALLVVAAG